jgi:hypothetical protein
VSRRGDWGWGDSRGGSLQTYEEIERQWISLAAEGGRAATQGRIFRRESSISGDQWQERPRDSHHVNEKKINTRPTWCNPKLWREWEGGGERGRKKEKGEDATARTVGVGGGAGVWEEAATVVAGQETQLDGRCSRRVEKVCAFQGADSMIHPRKQRAEWRPGREGERSKRKEKMAMRELEAVVVEDDIEYTYSVYNRPEFQNTHTIQFSLPIFAGKNYISSTPLSSPSPTPSPSHPTQDV